MKNPNVVTGEYIYIYKNTTLPCLAVSSRSSNMFSQRKWGSQEPWTTSFPCRWTTWTRRLWRWSTKTHCCLDVRKSPRVRVSGRWRWVLTKSGSEMRERHGFDTHLNRQRVLMVAWIRRGGGGFWRNWGRRWVSAVHGDYLTVGFVEHVADLNHGGGPEMGDGELTRLVPFLSFSRLGSPIKSDAFFL